MLGMQTPEMADAQRTQQIFAQSGGMETPEQIRAAASRFMNAGDNQRALLLTQLAVQRENELEKEAIEAQKVKISERKQDFAENQAFELKKLEAEARIRQNDERIRDARTSAEERAELLRDNNEIKRLLIQARGPILTKGQEAVDKNFGKEYAEYQAAGGSADVEKQLNQLQLVSNSLGRKGNNYTGPLVGLVPDAMRAFTNQDAVDAKNKVEEVAQRNLRLVLGAQFTQVEGERLIARAYNPSLSPSKNKKRVDALINQIRTAAQVKEDAARYFEENGTLAGWQGRMPTLSDFENAVDNADSKEPSANQSSSQDQWTARTKDDVAKLLRSGKIDRNTAKSILMEMDKEGIL
jgi:hypothetical protein